jgi:hypothetical protein
VLFLIVVLLFGIVAFTFLFGLSGLVLVKSKQRLINPHGPAIVALGYAVMWAAVIAFSMAAGSKLTSRFFSPVLDDRVLLHDAVHFGIGTAAAWFWAARGWKPAFTRDSIHLERAYVFASALLIFVLNPPHAEFHILTWLPDSLMRLIDALMFGVTFIGTFVKDGLWGPFIAAYHWLEEVHGNFFALSPILEKVLLLGAIVAWVRSRIAPKEEQKEAPIEPRPLTDKEKINFLQALALFAYLLAMPASDYVMPPSSYAWWMPFLIIAMVIGAIAAFFTLIATLFKSVDLWQEHDRWQADIRESEARRRARKR